MDHRVAVVLLQASIVEHGPLTIVAGVLARHKHYSGVTTELPPGLSDQGPGPGALPTANYRHQYVQVRDCVKGRGRTCGQFRDRDINTSALTMYQ